MMKRVSSIILSLILLLCFTTSSFCDEINIVRPSIEVKEVSAASKTIVAVDPEAPEDGPREMTVVAELVNLGDETKPFGDQKVLHYYEDPEVFITPYAEKDKIPYDALTEQRKETIKKNLEDAYYTILKLDTLGSLCGELDERAAALDKNYNSWIYVASEIFDISLDEYEENRLASDPGKYFTITVKLANPIDTSKSIAVLHWPQSTREWKLLPEESVRINEDGSVSLVLDSLCPIVVLSAQPERMNDYEAHKHNSHASENCKCPSWCPFCGLFCKSGSCHCLMALIITLLLIGILVWAIIYNRRKLHEEQARENNLDRILEDINNLRKKKDK